MEGHLKSENVLVKELKEGSIDAFKALYELYSLRLYHFGLRYLKSEIEAEGLVQNVFAKIWEKRSSLRTDLSFKSYIFTITFNFIKKHFIKESRLREYLQNANTFGESVSETSDHTEYHSLLEYLNTLVNQLPKKRRLIFIKSRIEGLPIKEIAREMGIRPKTVQNQLTSAIKFIRANWKDISAVPYQ